MVGGQDCHPKASGAHTGDISAAMLKDAGASHVILGHSERRTDHGETDALVRPRPRRRLPAGLVAIVCIGETEASATPGRR
jgi:triosephosphate isomerase (TIM)